MHFIPKGYTRIENVSTSSLNFQPAAPAATSRCIARFDRLSSFFPPTLPSFSPSSLSPSTCAAINRYTRAHSLPVVHLSTSRSASKELLLFLSPSLARQDLSTIKINCRERAPAIFSSSFSFFVVVERERDREREGLELLAAAPSRNFSASARKSKEEEAASGFFAREHDQKSSIAGWD